MSRIGIVVDSTADVPFSFYQEHHITVVPLKVHFGEESFKDWIDIDPETFYRRLKSLPVLPKTSQPSAADFENAYRNLAKENDSIISIHISSKLSGTVNSAQAAKAALPQIPIYIVDTGLASIGTAMVTQAAIREIGTAASIEKVIKAVEKVAEHIVILFAVDTLEYLQKGGRIGKASALLGSLLNIKPILTIKDGEVHPFKKIRGSTRLYQEFVNILKEQVESGKKLHLGLAHAANPQAVNRLKSQIEESGIGYDDLLISEIGPVIGTYTGPGAFALVFYQE